MDKKVLKCTRCGHEWVPFVEHPKRCPNCVSPYWDKPYARGWSGGYGRKCKWCGSVKLIKYGKRDNGVQELQCTECGKRFAEGSKLTNRERWA